MPKRTATDLVTTGSSSLCHASLAPGLCGREQHSSAKGDLRPGLAWPGCRVPVNDKQSTALTHHWSCCARCILPAARPARHWLHGLHGLHWLHWLLAMYVPSLSGAEPVSSLAGKVVEKRVCTGGQYATSHNARWLCTHCVLQCSVYLLHMYTRGPATRHSADSGVQQIVEAAHGPLCPNKGAEPGFRCWNASGFVMYRNVDSPTSLQFDSGPVSRSWDARCDRTSGAGSRSGCAVWMAYLLIF
jgi:hypothetical protein